MVVTVIGPENLNTGSDPIPSTLDQSIKYVYFNFLPIEIPHLSRGEQSDWSCELPNLVKTNQSKYDLVSINQSERDNILPRGDGYEFV